MKLPLESITVGSRRREDCGDIAGLAASIEKYGLLHPIVVDDAGTLVAGERRLRAVQSLGWEAIDCHDIGEVSDAWREEVELAENDDRKDLTPYERAKDTIRKAQRVAPVISAKLAEKAPQGRKPVHEAPRADIAQAIGTSETALRRDEQHVETVEQHPDLGGPDWKQYHVLEAREKLERIPEPERAKAVALVSQRDILPRDATNMLGNLAEMPAPERERVLTLAESPDTRDRDLAVTEAAKKPAMPDQRMHHLIDVIATLGQAERMYPGDSLNDRFTTLRNSARELLVIVKEYHHDA